MANRFGLLGWMDDLEETGEDVAEIPTLRILSEPGAHLYLLMSSSIPRFRFRDVHCNSPKITLS
jgi:hypothetical protein